MDASTARAIRAALLEEAGPRNFQHGLQYLHQGRVGPLKRLPSGEYEATVQGPRAYKVRFEPDALDVYGTCPCEVGQEEYELCEHVVAVGLALLDEVDAAAMALAPHGKGPAPGKPLPAELAYLERVPLAALAPPKHLGGGLAFPQLPASFGALLAREKLATVSLAEWWKGAARPGKGLTDKQRALLDAAVRGYVQVEPRLLSEGTHGTSSWWGSSVTSPRLAALKRGLTLHLRELSARVRPRYLPQGEWELTWNLGEDPVAIHYREHRAALDTSGALVMPEVVLLPRELKSHTLPALVCTCSPSPEALCPHRFSALAALYQALGAHEFSTEVRALDEALAGPAWQRVLQALQGTSAKGETAEAGAEVHWYVSGEDGDLTLAPSLRRPRKKQGGLTQPTALTAEKAERLLATLPPGPERDALELHVHLEDRWGLRDTSHRRTLAVVRKLVGARNVFHEDDPERPLEVRAVPLGLRVHEAPKGGWRMVPEVDGEPMAAEDLLDAMGEASGRTQHLYLDARRHRLLLLTTPPQAAQALRLMMGGGVHLPAGAQAELLSGLAGLGASMSLTLPPSLYGQLVESLVSLLLRLEAPPEVGLRGQLLVQVLEDHAPLPPGVPPAEVATWRKGGRVWALRDLHREHERARALAHGLEVELQEEGAFTLPGDAEALALLTRLQESPPAGLRVEWVARPLAVRRVASAEAVKLRVKAQGDWFGLEGEVELDGARLSLAALLDALRRDQGFVRGGDGTLWALSETLRQRLAAVADLSFSGRQGVEVSPAAAPALAALVEDGASLRAAAEWRTLEQRLQRASRLEPLVPDALQAQLRPYQREGFAWMARLTAWGAGCCLADDMGLGKTVQALALLVARQEEGPALVVAPSSVCFNWEREAARFAPSLRALVYRGAERAAQLEALGAGDVLIVSHALLARDVEALSQRTFATLVLDEAQALKNAETQRARAARALKAEARVALSGTPVENRLGELWSLFRILFPGLLGSQEQFRERFIKPIEREGRGERKAALARLLKPYVLRRTKTEVARELPPRTESVVPVVLGPGERRLYEEARLAAVARLSGHAPRGGSQAAQERIVILAALTRLRLLACHPKLGDAKSRVPSSKLQRALELLGELREEGHRALVFSQFVKHLDLVEEALRKEGVSFLRLDGSTPLEERARRVDAFQRGEADVFLVSLKAGGTGLNLTAANYVLHLDPWWNPAVEDQATDRAHRIGQDKPVTVLRLVSEGTIEEAILALHAKKRELVDGLLDESGEAAGLSTEELMALLRYSRLEASAEGQEAGDALEA